MPWAGLAPALTPLTQPPSGDKAGIGFAYSAPAINLLRLPYGDLTPLAGGDISAQISLISPSCTLRTGLPLYPCRGRCPAARNWPRSHRRSDVEQWDWLMRWFWSGCWDTLLALAAGSTAPEHKR